MTSLAKTRTFLIALIIFCFFSTFNLKADSSQATVPINITVNGKLIITDAENDTKSGTNPTLNVLLKLTPDLGSSVVSGKSAIRIRTNLNNWKLTAQRNDISNSTNIDPEQVSLSFTTEAGSKADLYSGKLLAPFDTVTNLGQISTGASTDILSGTSKTSIGKDPENKDNWFQLTSNYSVEPDFFYNTGEWSTVVSYSLVSP